MKKNAVFDNLRKEAWEMLGYSFEWSEALLEKYQDKIDWDSISINEHIPWTIPMIQKFQHRINWSLLTSWLLDEKLSEEFIEAFQDKWDWGHLSPDFSWTETLLEKHQDEVDWKKISWNNHILWTIPMIQKFQHRINWKELSSHISNEVLTENLIEAFRDKWNWEKLSGRIEVLSYELIDKFVDKWDWGKLIGNKLSEFYEREYSSTEAPSLIEKNAIEFYERYKDYIPTKKLRDSRLWVYMLEEYEPKLIAEITA